MGDQIKEAEMSGICSTRGRDTKFIYYFGWNAQREETPGRPRRRWEYNIRMVIREIGSEVVDWIQLAQERD
jgi:hypothetical protein